MPFYYFNYTIGNKKFLTYMVTTEDIESINEDPSGVTGGTYLETANKFDEYLNENSIYFPWEAIVYPLRSRFYDTFSHGNHFPGIYQDDSEILVGDKIIYDGQEVGQVGTVIDTKNVFGISSNDNGMVTYYNLPGYVPPLHLYSFFESDIYASLYFGIIIAEKSAISDGKFSLSGKKYRLFTPRIQRRYDKDDRWDIGFEITEVRTFGTFPIDGMAANAAADDPFGPGGDSGTGGGGGDFDNTSTPIDIPGLPSVSAASTGFISLFNPSLSQLNDLASYLWSDLFEIDGWKKLFADPMDAILGLSILPVSVPSGGTREVKVGNIGTGISLTVAASQFVEVDCGSIDVNEYWGAYLDYEPYTQAQIFLPYIGTRPISVDEIMGKTVRVVYHVDILTGACCCFVKCGDSVLYTYNGQCSIPIPITGANYASVVNGVISVAASVGSLVATGGASAPIAIPAIASSAVNQMKPQIEKSGSISGSAGVLNMQTPYLILIRPRQALPSKQNEFIGYPSLITVQLTELSGYTEVQSIHLENIPATQEELAEIQSLLEGGVIF